MEELDSPSPVDISDTDNSQAAASSKPPGGKTWWDEALGTLVMQLPDQRKVQATIELGDKGFCKAVWPWGQSEMTEKPWLGLQPVIFQPKKTAACKRPAAKQAAKNKKNKKGQVL